MELNFKMKEIPFEELKMIGMSKEMFLDLPKQVMDHLMSGRMSPLLRLDMEIDGRKAHVPAKLGFERDSEGKLHVMTYLIKKEINNNLSLSKEQLEKLKNDETVIHTIEKDGKKEKVLVQLDKETRTLITSKQEQIKVPEAIDNIVLGDKQKETIREGKPIELEVGDTKITVGVDLNARGGFKVVEGGMDDWKVKKLMKWDMATPGVMGYWRTAENAWEYEKHQEKQEQKQEHKEGRSSVIDEEIEQKSSMRWKR